MAENLRLTELNRVLLVGRLAADPESQVTEGGRPMAKLRLAYNRRYMNRDGEWTSEEGFFRVTAWGPLATRCEERCRVGDAVLVEGRLRESRWTTQEGKSRSSVEVVADRLQRLNKTSVAEEVVL